MEVDATTMMFVGFCIAFVTILLTKALSWLWLEPKRAERYLRRQGLKGNSYTLFFGDIKAISTLIQKAKTKPLDINDDVTPRLVPFQHHLI